MRNTLPQLRLDRLIDMFQYVDQAQGASGLVSFIEEHIEHERASDWVETISGVLVAGVGTSESLAPLPPAPVETTTTTTTPPAGTGSTSGKVPPGLVPAN